MMYELTMVYENKTHKVEKADLPTLMHCLSYYMQEEPWTHIEIMNCQTDEIIAAWEHNDKYGVAIKAKEKKEMKKDFDKEACPVCESENYEVEDYGDDFCGDDGGAQWWHCRCDKCGCLFNIARSYKLVDISVTEEG